MKLPLCHDMTDKAVPLTPPAELTRVGRDLDISLLTPKPGIPKIHLTDTPHSISPEIKEEGKVTVVRDYKPLRSDVLSASPHTDIMSEQSARRKASAETNEVGYQPVYVDYGVYITPADIVTVAKHGARVAVQDIPTSLKNIRKSVDILHEHLQDGHSLYGITTGFGGSATTRTNKTFELQRALLQMQQSGILPVVKEPGSIHGRLRSSPGMTFMPEEWVRGAMLVRCKSLLNGHSAIRWELIVTLITLLNENLIPLVPLRGSISASGDLNPLSYIAGAMEGNPDIWVWSDGHGGERVLIPSNIALTRSELEPQTFGPKEGLAVLNGTAFSTSVSAIALHEANQLAVLSQVLTAMGVEALSGASGNYDPFFAKVRLHKGQAEAACNILSFLDGSLLTCRMEEAGGDDTRLKQDRYALRTASQWIGPQLEDLTLAYEQISVECNSTTDNPLVNIDDRTIRNGGNFQAASVTSAMEKTRLCLQMFGRMLFSQCTELINPTTNNGLPPNLAADEPSTSYTFKGIDINVAAYMSELAYLANPVSSHVQTAEMGNQAINSLALVSARYTHQAIEILAMICAAYLYSLCQALDLRVMNRMFIDAAMCEVRQLTYEAFEYIFKNGVDNTRLQDLVVRHMLKQLLETTDLDSADRFEYIANSAQGAITAFFYQLDSTQLNNSFGFHEPGNEWKIRCSIRLLDIFTNTRKQYFEHGNASPYLGKASLKIYTFVRNELKVPFHHGLASCPSISNGYRTVGGNTSVIYEALRDGRLYDVVMGLVRDVGSEKVTDEGIKKESSQDSEYAESDGLCMA